MSDFYSILKQSIVDRGLRTPAQREDVYGQARTAMIRKLWSYDPPLAEDEIDARIGTFDRAVERIEGDLVALFAEKPARIAPPARRAAPVAAPAEAYDDEADIVPASFVVPTRRAPPAAPQSAAQGKKARHDPLAERSAAIEEALRGNYAEREAEALEDEHEQDEASPDTQHETEWEERDAHPHEDYEEEEDRDDEQSPSRDAPATERAKPWQRLPSPAAQWSASSEQTKIRVLVGAIGALGIVLVAAGIYVAVSLLSGGSEAPTVPSLPVAAAGGTPEAAVATAAASADVVQSFSLFDGTDPTVFESTPDNPVRFDKDAGGAGLARVSSSASSPGVRLNIGPGIATQLAGKPVRLVILARSAKESGAANMRFAYQSGVALSHWQTANLSDSDVALGLVWRVPRMQTDPNGDYVLIEPGIPGDGTAVDIHSVRLDLLAKEPE